LFLPLLVPHDEREADVNDHGGPFIDGVLPDPSHVTDGHAWLDLRIWNQ
jgi:hypothetical protein